MKKKSSSRAQKENRKVIPKENECGHSSDGNTKTWKAGDEDEEEEEQGSTPPHPPSNFV